MEYMYSSTNFRNYEKKLGLLKNKICTHLFYVEFRNEHRWNLIFFLAWHMVKKPGSHMPPMHLRHGRRYCLGYCSDKRTEVAGNLAIPVFTAGMPAKLTEVELRKQGFSAKQEKCQRKKKSLQHYRALSDNCLQNKMFVSKMISKTGVWPVKSAIRPTHCLLTGHYFQPCWQITIFCSISSNYC